jgi:hypothetical protein
MKYIVSMRITFEQDVEVEADSESEATATAQDKFDPDEADVSDIYFEITEGKK